MRKQVDYEQRRLQIIDGALEVFSTKGFVKATNKDIAAAAGINSPGLIYHYFKDKADLLREVAEAHAPPLQMVAHSDELMAMPPEEALTRYASIYLSLLDTPNFRAFLRLMMGEALRDPEFAVLFGEIGPFRVWRLLADYLQNQMDRGILRKTDSILAARCFIGPLVMQILTQHIFRLPTTPDVDPQALVAVNVEIFLRGMKPDA